MMSGRSAFARSVAAASMRGAVAADAGRDAGRGAEIELRLGVQHVGRERQEHRAGRWRERGLRGAVDHARQIGEAVHLGRPFHQRAGERRQVGPQDRLGDVEALVVLAGGDEDAARRLLGVVEHAHGVAEPGRDMEVHHRELAGRLRVAVGHRHRGRLLQGEHVADVALDRERVHQRQLGGAGIAEHDLDAFLLQDLEEGALSGDAGHGLAAAQ